MLMYITWEDISSEAVILIILLNFTKNARVIQKLAGCEVKQNYNIIERKLYFYVLSNFFKKIVYYMFKNAYQKIQIFSPALYMVYIKKMLWRVLWRHWAKKRYFQGKGERKYSVFESFEFFWLLDIWTCRWPKMNEI